MNKLVIKILLLMSLTLAIYLGHKGLQIYLGKQAVNGIAFTVHDFEDAKHKAMQEGKLVLADYSAIWCPSCRKLDMEVFANENIAQTIESEFVYTRIEYDSNEGKEFAERYDVVGFPRVLVLKPNGDKILEMPLTFDPIEYNYNLQRVISSMALQN